MLSFRRNFSTTALAETSGPPDPSYKTNLSNSLHEKVMMLLLGSEHELDRGMNLPPNVIDDGVGSSVSGKWCDNRLTDREGILEQNNMISVGLTHQRIQTEWDSNAVESIRLQKIQIPEI